MGSDALAHSLAAFWKERLRDHFPAGQQQPPYSPPVEQFPSAGQGSGFQFELGVSIPTPRLLVSRDGEQELLQLQPGWFACNWRKVRPQDEYDHWQRRRDAFERWFTELSDFLAREGVGEPKVTRCEVTYINHVEAGDVWSHHAEFERIFNVSFGAGTPTRLEQVSAQAQFTLDQGRWNRMADCTRKSFLRLRGMARHPCTSSNATARGAPRGNGLAGAVAFLDLGREAIDGAFVGLDHSEMHAMLERTMSSNTLAWRRRASDTTTASRETRVSSEAQLGRSSAATASREVLPAMPALREFRWTPTWLAAAARRLTELSKRPTGWDSYGALSLQDGVAERTYSILDDLSGAIQGPPAISLTSEGGLSAIR